MIGASSFLPMFQSRSLKLSCYLHLFCSEDEGAPSPLTHRLSNMNVALSRNTSMASMKSKHSTFSTRSVQSTPHKKTSAGRPPPVQTPTRSFSATAIVTPATPLTPQKGGGKGYPHSLSKSLSASALATIPDLDGLEKKLVGVLVLSENENRTHLYQRLRIHRRIHKHNLNIVSPHVSIQVSAPKPSTISFRCLQTSTLIGFHSRVTGLEAALAVWRRMIGALGALVREAGAGAGVEGRVPA